VGTFNGTSFTADTDSVYLQSSGQANWLDYGPDFYAAATYNGLDNYERIAITWMNDWGYASLIPTSPWRSAMTIPRKLTLETMDGKSRLISTPHHNVQALERGPLLYSKQWNSTASGDIALPVSGKALDIAVTFSPGTSSKQLALGVRTNGKSNGTLIGYDFASQQMFVDRNSASDNSSFSPSYQGKYYAPLSSQDGHIKMRIFLDWSSVEVFGGRGESTITAQIFPLDSNTGISLFSDGDATDVSIQVAEVPSVWKK
jgi:sucrose-6-phosphate hydrolase SacC (GH32 family)